MVRGQPEPAAGPLVAWFRFFGGLFEGQLVAGPWGELSPHLHQLLRLFAESRVAARARAQGWEDGPNMLGKVMGEVGLQSHGDENSGPLPAGEAGPPGARGPGRCPEEVGHHGAVGEEEKGKACLRPDQPGVRPGPCGQGFHPVNYTRFRI